MEGFAEQQPYDKTLRVPFRHQVRGDEHLMSEVIVDEGSDTGQEELWSDVTVGSLKSRDRGTQEHN